MIESDSGDEDDARPQYIIVPRLPGSTAVTLDELLAEFDEIIGEVCVAVPEHVFYLENYHECMRRCCCTCALAVNGEDGS